MSKKMNNLVNMDKKLPFNSGFKWANILDMFAQRTLIISSLIVIVVFFFDAPNSIIFFLRKFNCFLIVAYFGFTLARNYLFSETSRKRIHDFINNSFDINLSSKKSKDYFTNDHIDPGVYKMGVNCFESAFFSLQIAKAMRPRILIKYIIICCVFLVSILWDFLNVKILILELGLTFVLIGEILGHLLYVKNLEQNFNCFTSLFSQMKDRGYNVKDNPYIYCYVLDYESITSNSNILLDTKIYNTQNQSLSNDWMEIKRTYKIENL